MPTNYLRFNPRTAKEIEADKVKAQEERDAVAAWEIVEREEAAEREAAHLRRAPHRVRANHESPTKGN